MNSPWGLSGKVLFVLSLRVACGKGLYSGCLICEVTTPTLVRQVGGEMRDAVSPYRIGAQQALASVTESQKACE